MSEKYYQGQEFVFNNITYYLVKTNLKSCYGCSFGPKSKCRNEFMLCIKHCGEEYIYFIYRKKINVEVLK